MTMKTALFRRLPLDFRVCAVIFLAAAYLFVTSRDMPDKAVLFPSIMLVCLMGLSVYCMVLSLLRQARSSQDKGAASPAARKAPVNLRAVCALGGMTALYAFLTPLLGFGLSSVLFIGFGMVFFGERDIRAIVAVPLVMMLFVYGFFICFLDVGIPFFPISFSA